MVPGLARSRDGSAASWSRTARDPWLPLLWETCRSGPRCLWNRGTRCTKACWLGRTPGPAIWTSTSPRKRSSPTCGPRPRTTTSSWNRPARSPSSTPSSTSRKMSSSRSRPRPSASASGCCRRTIARRPPGPPGWRTRRKSLMAEDIIMGARDTSGEPVELRRKFDDDEDEFEDDGFTFDDEDEDDEDLDDDLDEDDDEDDLDEEELEELEDVDEDEELR